MSELEYVDLGDLDGTHGWIVTSGFVNWEEEIASQVPHQRVRLGDESTTGTGVVCTVFDEELTLEEGCGYYLVGKDRTYGRHDEVQLSLFESSSIRKFHE